MRFQLSQYQSDKDTWNAKMSHFSSYKDPMSNYHRGMKLIQILLAIFIPPLGVFLAVGLTGAFWLNILLTLLGYVPGLIHAIWVIIRS